LTRGVSNGPANTRVLLTLVTRGWELIGEIDPFREERAIFRRPRNTGQIFFGIKDQSLSVL